jgi:signal transduction histidine kinase
MTEQCDKITADELATFDLFKDDTRAALEWLAERFEVRCLAAGEQFIKTGEPATEFMVVLEGEVHFARDGDAYGNDFIRTAGQPTGVLPFSRMKMFRGRGWAVPPSRVIVMQSSHLSELVYQAPMLTQKLVNEMLDRSRDFTQRNERANKMLALGKLSAGLAHELNNPASAVVRSASRLREVLMERRKHAIALKGEVITPAAQSLLTDLGEMIAEAARTPRQLDALERADLEAEISDWLDSHHLPNDAAPALVETGIPISRVEPLLRLIGPNNFVHGMHMLAADFEVFSLSREIEEASRRIADLVHAVKAYSYMDRVPTTEVDVEQGIEVTLRMFQHQLKHGYEVKKVFAHDLPKINANGGELNQIWTNLIDNAIDAMRDSPAKVLEIRTCTEPGGIVVDVIDSGEGIPRDVQARIFDPFFTTKDVGKGTGLGLDIVARIIRSHNGSIRVESKPGRTLFQVRLPLGHPAAEAAAAEPVEAVTTTR